MTTNFAVGEVELPGPIDLLRSFRFQRFGLPDPTFELTETRLLRAFDGPSGALTMQMTALAPDRIRVEAWGADASWAIEQAPSWLGIDDDDSGFQPENETLRRLKRTIEGLRMVGSPSLFDLTVRLILQQRVAWRDAVQSFRRLTVAYGQPAPGPFALKTALGASAWRRIPQPEYAARGVEAKRARTIRDAAVSARRIEEIRSMSIADADRRLRAFKGIGVWTAQGVLGFGLGYPDAVQEQDYDLPRLVSFALSGEPRADDARMLKLLRPYAGHRFRVVRLLHESDIRTPRFGPRKARSKWETEGDRWR